MKKFPALLAMPCMRFPSVAHWWMVTYHHRLALLNYANSGLQKHVIQLRNFKAVIILPS